MENDHPLSDAMAAHDHSGHDLSVIRANIDALAKKYRQRRLLQQSAAGVVIGASLFAGASHFADQTDPWAPAAAVTTIGAQLEPGKDGQPDDGLSLAEREAITRFSAAGYDYADAVELGRLWKNGDVTATKIAAGEQLLAKRPLPFPPTSQVYDGQTADEAAMVDAFFARGYDFGDAKQLAELWNKASAYEAKVEAGKKLLNGESLPVQP